MKIFIAGSTTQKRRIQNSKKNLFADWRKYFPYIGRSAIIGTAIGALPGVGSTLAATLGIFAKRRYMAKKADPDFGKGVPEGLLRPKLPIARSQVRI